MVDGDPADHAGCSLGAARARVGRPGSWSKASWIEPMGIRAIVVGVRLSSSEPGRSIMTRRFARTAALLVSTVVSE
jgi:hypothetical protein